MRFTIRAKLGAAFGLTILMLVKVDGALLPSSNADFREYA